MENLIRNASLHPAASTGQYLLGEFMKSCLGIKTKVNIADVLMREDLGEIIEILKLVESRSLKTQIKLLNPELYAEIYKSN